MGRSHSLFVWGPELSFSEFSTRRPQLPSQSLRSVAFVWEPPFHKFMSQVLFGSFGLIICCFRDVVSGLSFRTAFHNLSFRTFVSEPFA